jgi:hypothetical protein
MSEMEIESIFNSNQLFASSLVREVKKLVQDDRLINCENLRQVQGPHFKTKMCSTAWIIIVIL